MKPYLSHNQMKNDNNTTWTEWQKPYKIQSQRLQAIRVAQDLRNDRLLDLQDGIRITLAIFYESTSLLLLLQMELKQNVHLKTELMVTVTSTLDDLWLVIMNSPLLGYPGNNSFTLNLLTWWNLYSLELLFPNQCCFHLVLVALNRSTCLQEITTSVTSVRVQPQWPRVLQRRLSGSSTWWTHR